MRYNLHKIIPGLVLAAMLLSMVPVGVPAAHAATYQEIYAQCIESGGTNAGCTTFANSEMNANRFTPQPVTTNKYDPAKPPADDFGCSIGTLFSNCVASVVYWIGPGIASYVTYVGAYFFSIVVQLSLNSTAYALDFLSTGWTTVRDIANMAFIFILIYIALTVMLAAETSGTIKTLAVVIVIALLVNFSFFFTRVVIDTGNIVAVQFYNAIPYQGSIGNGNNTKDLSLSIMNAVQIQSLYGQDAFNKAKDTCGIGTSVMCGLIVSTVIYLSVAAMLWMLFFAFLQVGIKFMLRIVGLWFVLIASPLAFVAQTMPQTKRFFKQWLDYLIKFSFYPAIFLFMFWVLTKFATSILSSGTNGVGNGSLFNSVLNVQGTTVGATSATVGITTAVATVAIRMGFVVAVLYVGLKVSDWIVKEGSAIASKFSGGVFGAGKFAAKWGPGWAAGAGYRWTGGAIAAGTSNALQRSKWANQPGTIRGMIGYRLRKNVVEPLANTSLGTVASNYRGREKFLTERRQEMEGNLVNRSAKKDADRLAEINKTWEQDESQLEMWRGQEKRGIKLDPPAQVKYKRLEELNTERASLSRRMENMTTSQVTSLKASTIEGVIKQISENNLKALKESGKYTVNEIKNLTTKWHEQNQKAPIGESRKQLELLSKVHETLKKMNVNIKEIDRYAGLAPGSKVTVDLRGAEEMKRTIVNEKESFESIRDNRTAAAADRTAAGEKAKKLNKALEHAEKIIEKLKEVPEQVGNVAAPAAFEHTAK